MATNGITATFPGEDPYDKYAVKTKDPYEKYATGATAPQEANPNATPYVPKHSLTPITTYFSPPNGLTPMADPYTAEQRDAAARGVNIDAKLPYKTSVLSWLADNPEQRNSIVKQSLQKSMGLPDDAFRTSPSGEVEYMEPSTGAWMAANPASLSNIPGFIEEAGSVIGGIGGAVLGTGIGGPGAGTLVGGAAGTVGGRTAGSAARDLWAQSQGVSSKQGPQILLDGMGEGLIDANFNLLGDAAYLGGKGIKTWYFGREALKPGEAKVLLDAYNSADTLRRQVDAVIGPDIANIDASMAAYARGDKQTLDRVAPTKTDHRTAELWDTRDDANDRAAQMFFENITVPQRMQGVETQAVAGDPLRQAITDERFAAQAPVVAELDAAQRGAQSALKAIPETMDKAGTGRGIRDAVRQEYDKAVGETRQAYGEYAKAAGIGKAGVSNIDVPVSRGLRSLQRRLEKEIDRAPIEEMAAIKKKAILQNIEEGTVNLADLDSLIKYVGKSINKKNANKVGVEMDSVTAIELRKTLVKMRNDYLKKDHPEVFEALMDSQAAVVRERSKFGTALMKSLLKKEDNGEYKLASAIGVTRLMRTNDSEAAAAVAEVMRSNPKAMLQTQNYLMALYRDKVGTGAEKLIPDYTAHRKFLKQYGNTMREFFTDKEWDQVQSIGGFAEVISKNTEKLQQLDSMWKADFKGKMDNMSAESLTNAVFDTGAFSQGELATLSRLAKNYGPEVNAKWKAGVAETIRTRMFDGDTINQNYLKSLVDDPNMLARLNEVFGPGYSRGLTTLNKFITTVKPVARPRQGAPRATALSDIAKVLYARPLSVEGLMLSGGQRARARQLPIKLYNAMTNASELNRLAENMNAIANRIGIAGTTGNIYGALLEEEDFYE